MIEIEALGERALLLRWSDRIDPEVNDRVHALAARLGAEAPPWLLDLVPAYASLALVLDADAFTPEDDPLAIARAWVATRLDAPPAPARIAAAAVAVPVCYGGEFGPDLTAVAAATGLHADEVVARHSGGDYRVAMLGFAPGFPYLLGLDPALALPRLATPRRRVPAGSVGIGGAQTGIYPRESPGGWHLLGRTPLGLFDASRDPPARLAPGDRVRFMPIAADAFERMRRQRVPR